MRRLNLTRRMIMNKNKWIKTTEMLAEIKMHPNEYIEYEHHLMGPLVRTHCFIYNEKTGTLEEDGGECDFQETTEEELLAFYGNSWWRKV